MPTGTVKWFNRAKGYGFIEPEDGSKDAFVHISAVQSAGMETLDEGQKIQYELVEGANGKQSAENLVDSDSHRLTISIDMLPNIVAHQEKSSIYGNPGFFPGALPFPSGRRP